MVEHNNRVSHNEIEDEMIFEDNESQNKDNSELKARSDDNTDRSPSVGDLVKYFSMLSGN